MRYLNWLFALHGSAHARTRDRLAQRQQRQILFVIIERAQLPVDILTIPRLAVLIVESLTRHLRRQALHASEHSHAHSNIPWYNQTVIFIVLVVAHLAEV